MSIDEFGQFKRKRPVQRNNNRTRQRETNQTSQRNNDQVRQENHEPIHFGRAILGYIVNIFRQRGLGARIEQVLTCVLWILYIVLLVHTYSSEGLFITIIFGIFYFLLGSVGQLFISLFSDWAAREIRERRYEYLGLITVFIVIMMFLFISIYAENYSSNSDYSDTRKYTEYYTEEQIGNEMYYCNKEGTYVYKSLDERESFPMSLNMMKGEECIVLSSIGDYYKVQRDMKPIGYVMKKYLTFKYRALNDTLIAANLDEVIVTAIIARNSEAVKVNIPTYDKKQLDIAKKHFRYPSQFNTHKYTNGQVRHDMYISKQDYWGHVNSKGERHGEGAYKWDRDSIYIGNWENGAISGYGMMYYYKTGKEKNGIWEYNNLIKPYRPLTDKVKFYRVDSTQRVWTSMIFANIRK